MRSLTALGFVVGFFTVVSHKPEMVGLIIGIFALCAVGSTLSKLVRN